MLAANPTAKTVDGGATWNPVQQDPFQVGGLLTVDCTTDVVCSGFDGAGQFFRTLDGGSTWTPTRSTGLVNVTQLECQTASHCIAASQVNGAGALWITDDGGGTWSRRYLNTSPSSVNHLSCASTLFCAALDGGATLATTDGGRDWGAVSLPGPTTSATLLGCAAPAMCTSVTTGVGNQVVLTRSINGGISWPVFFVTLPFTPIAFTCTTASFCIGTGNLNGTFNAGAFTIDLSPLPDLPVITLRTVPNRL
jgi:hypothetical protein